MAKNKVRLCNLEVVLLYFGFFAVNSLVIWLANMFLPSYVVLGTEWITKCWAMIHSMATLALVDVFMVLFGREYETMKKKVLASGEWLAIRLVVNSVGLWLIARLAKQLGLGISSWLVVIVLGFVLSVAQRKVLMWIKEIKKLI